MKLIDNQLVPVYETDKGDKVVDARELHEFLGSKQDFTNWIKNRIEKYGFVMDEDFSINLSKSTGGRPTTDYTLALDTAKELAMVESNAKGRKARKYFIEIEKRFKNQPQHTLPQSLPEALRAYALEVEKVEVLQLENQELKQKTSYVDQILKSKGTMTITQIAKDYGMSGPQLNKLLHEESIQYKQNKQWLLYQKHQDQGYTKSETIDIRRSNGDPDVTLNTRWTQKGRLFIHELLSKRNIIPYTERQSA